MEELKTPRKIIDEDNIDCWSDEIEEMLSEWGEIALCYAWLHNYSERKYKRKYHHMSIPIIVLSTLVVVLLHNQQVANKQDNICTKIEIL